jgi:hypothetical protein
VDNEKGEFPYKFVNKDNYNNYIGKTPDKSFFKNPNKVVYTENYNLKEETIKYLTNDIKILHKVLAEFSKYMGNLENINFTSVVSLPSLAYKIYRQNYYSKKYIKSLDKDKIFDYELKVHNRNIEETLRNSYYGGHTEVYKNKIENGYYYDINSQYPYAMLNNMPVGNPLYTDSIDDLNNDFFGFIYANIDATKAKRGLLP